MTALVRLAVALFIALMPLAAGCQSPRPGRPLAKELAGSDPDAQINFWHALAEEPVATNDQAFRALLLYLDAKDDSPGYAERVANLKSRDLLPPDFDAPAEAPVRRGTLAVAVVRVLGQKGGVNLRLLRDNPRYAVRELMFLEVYPASTPNQSFTGNELVGIIGRVEDFQRGNPADAPAAVLPGEMSQR